MTPESAALRESIRQGRLSAAIDPEEFEWAVARVYELERKAENIPLFGYALINWKAP
jgi:hypothetical protein